MLSLTEILAFYDNVVTDAAYVVKTQPFGIIRIAINHHTDFLVRLTEK